MKTLSYTIKDPLGIHVRPAGMLAKEAKQFQSSITIEKDGNKTSVTKLMAVMAMAIKQGQTIRLCIDGPDEEQAAQAMQTFFEQNL